MGRMVNTRRHDNVPRWLDRIVAAGAVLLIILGAVAAALAVSNVARADELPPGYVEPPGPCVLDVESGLWLAPGPLPCGPTLLALAGATEPLPSIDPETGCTPAVPSVGCPGDTEPIMLLEQSGCVGDPDYCNPVATTAPPPTTVTASTSTTRPPATTTTTVAATTTTAPATSTTTSVAVAPPPTPAPTTTALSVALPSPSTAPAPIGELPVTGNTEALWKLAAGACAAGLIFMLVSVARRR